MKLPTFLFRLLPLWSYICPRCRREVKCNSHKCPYCGEKYGKPLRVPPRFLKNQKALEEYVHKYIFPRISVKQREYLAQFFTEYLNSGWEDSGGTDITDGGKWDGTSSDEGCTVEVISTDPYQGSYSAHATTAGNTGDYVYCYKSFTAQEIVYARAYFKFKQLNIPSGKRIEILTIDSGAWQYAVAAALKNDSGTTKWLLVTQENGVYQPFLGTNSPELDAWYCVEIMRDVVNDEQKLWVNGNLEVSATRTITTNTSRVRCGITHQESTGINEIIFDCVVVADTYIGPISETTEIQVSDSVAGTETISRPYRFFSLTDTAFGQEVMLKTRNLSLSDIAIGLETLRKARDIGTITDTAQGLEQILKQRLIKLLDQAAGSETIARPTRIIIMADEALSQEIIGKLREIAAITDSAIGMEYISAGKVGESIKTKIFLFIGDLAIQVTGD